MAASTASTHLEALIDDDVTPPIPEDDSDASDNDGVDAVPAAPAAPAPEPAADDDDERETESESESDDEEFSLEVDMTVKDGDESTDVDLDARYKCDRYRVDGGVKPQAMLNFQVVKKMENKRKRVSYQLATDVKVFGVAHTPARRHVLKILVTSDGEIKSSGCGTLDRHVEECWKDVVSHLGAERVKSDLSSYSATAANVRARAVSSSAWLVSADDSAALAARRAEPSEGRSYQSEIRCLIHRYVRHRAGLMVYAMECLVDKKPIRAKAVKKAANFNIFQRLGAAYDQEKTWRQLDLQVARVNELQRMQRNILGEADFDRVQARRRIAELQRNVEDLKQEKAALEANYKEMTEFTGLDASHRMTDVHAMKAKIAEHTSRLKDAELREQGHMDDKLAILKIQADVVNRMVDADGNLAAGADESVDEWFASWCHTSPTSSMKKCLSLLSRDNPQMAEANKQQRSFGHSDALDDEVASQAATFGALRKCLKRCLDKARADKSVAKRTRASSGRNA